MASAPNSRFDSQGRYLVVGRPGPVYPRLSIEELQLEHPRQFTLFIIAYLVIQGREIEESAMNSLGLLSFEVPEPASFLALAGVHGLPYERWPGDLHDTSAGLKDHVYNENDPKDTDPIPSRFGGYCNHGSVAFPTWHRPYLMAIEQSIGDIAVQIAAKLDTQSGGREWLAAAEALRFPFWDWAGERVAQEGLPGVLHEQKVQIYVSEGTPYISIDNPLAYYKFKVVPRGFLDVEHSGTGATAYFSQWKRTFRYAESSPDAKESNTDKLNEELRRHAPDLRRKVSLLFSNDMGDTQNPWDEFSNHTAQSKREQDFRNTGSLEGIHDQLHVILGGNGHMADPDYAGFDPIFFLHHCNVDRLLAFWEYVYPKYFIEGDYENDGRKYSFTQENGTYWASSKLDGQTALAPFRNADGEYWTSDMTRLGETKQYPKYYTYPETGGVDISKDATDEDRMRYRAQLQAYYGPKPTKGTIPAIPIEARPAQDGIADDRHFILVVQTPEFAFNGSYMVEIHYGAKDDKDYQFVGSVAVFARSDESACEACTTRRNASSTIRGVISIPTDVIAKEAKAISGNPLDLDSAKPLDQLADNLRKNLNGYILNRYGRTVGHTENRVRDGMEPLLVIPEITLLSAAASKEGPVSYFDWKKHYQERINWYIGEGADN